MAGNFHIAPGKAFQSPQGQLVHEFKPFDTHTYNVSHANLTLTLTLMVVVVAACHPLAMALLTMSQLRPIAMALPTYLL